MSLLNTAASKLKLPALGAVCTLAAASFNSCSNVSTAGTGVPNPDGTWSYNQQPAGIRTTNCGDARHKHVYAADKNGNLVAVGAETDRLAPSETFNNYSTGGGRIAGGVGSVLLGDAAQDGKLGTEVSTNVRQNTKIVNNVKGSIAKATAGATVTPPAPVTPPCDTDHGSH